MPLERTNVEGMDDDAANYREHTSAAASSFTEERDAREMTSHLVFPVAGDYDVVGKLCGTSADGSLVTCSYVGRLL